MNNIPFIVAFSAGLLSFLSPCVLPLVPAYVGYLTGTSAREMTGSRLKFRSIYKSFGFVLGFSIVFILMGASITTLGRLFTVHKNVLMKIGGLLIIIFGLHTAGIFKIKLFYYEKRLFSFNKISGNFSSIIMGMAFATGWTPCIGPILSSILIYAASMDTINKGIILLVIYSLGLAVPFILTALAVDTFTEYIRKFSKYMPLVSLISGILMIIMGTLVLTNKVNALSSYFNFFNF
jgi:cytochrome c-type biogenesis protein